MGQNGGARKGAGRKAGGTNEKNKAIHESIDRILKPYMSGEGIGDNHRTLEEDLDAMPPSERAKVITGLLPYRLPKLGSIEVNAEVKNKTFEDELEALSKEDRRR